MWKFFCAGIDVHCEPCQRFFREGLTISFTKILTDDAVNGWKQEIHVKYFVKSSLKIYIVWCCVTANLLINLLNF